MDYSMQIIEWDVTQRLREARARADGDRVAAMAHRPRLGPALRRIGVGLRAAYVRSSSAASIGSKPTTARAWSRSR